MVGGGDMKPSGGWARRRRGPAALLALTLLGGSSACGTRVRTEGAAPAIGHPTAPISLTDTEPAAPADLNGPRAGGQPGSTPSSGARGPGSMGAATGGQNTATRPAAAPPVAGGPTPATRPETATPVKTGPVPSDQAGSASNAPPGPGSPAGAEADPIVVASVGSYSGVAGGTLGAIVQGAQLWTKAVNSNGGLNGHPVRLVVFDDGADPARHRQQVQDAVERVKVIAFLTNAEVLTGRPSIEYLNSKRIPVVGGDTAAEWYYESPMHFPQASSGRALLLGLIAGAAQQFLPQGLRRLGYLVCTEAQVCKVARTVFDDNAARLGFELVYRAQAS